jgi:hypothetical protein
MLTPADIKYSSDGEAEAAHNNGIMYGIGSLGPWYKRVREIAQDEERNDALVTELKNMMTSKFENDPLSKKAEKHIVRECASCPDLQSRSRYIEGLLPRLAEFKDCSELISVLFTDVCCLPMNEMTYWRSDFEHLCAPNNKQTAPRPPHQCLVCPTQRLSCVGWCRFTCNCLHSTGLSHSDPRTRPHPHVRGGFSKRRGNQILWWPRVLIASRMHGSRGCRSQP